MDAPSRRKERSEMVVLTQTDLNEKLSLARALDAALHGAASEGGINALELRNNCHPATPLRLWYIAPTLVVRCSVCDTDIVAIQVAASAPPQETPACDASPT
jgi:hypothetical protein